MKNPLVDVSSGKYEIETNEFKKFHICLNNLKNTCYNELTEEEQRYLELFMTDEVNKLKKIAGENEIMKKVVKSLESLSGDSEVISAYEKEEIEKYAFQVALEEKKQEGIKQGELNGRKKGEKVKQIEIAKNLLKENVNIDTISKTTGLTITEIENLK